MAGAENFHSDALSKKRPSYVRNAVTNALRAVLKHATVLNGVYFDVKFYRYCLAATTEHNKVT